MGSRAVVVVCRDEAAAARALRRRRRRHRHLSTPAPGGASSTTRRWKRRCWRACARRSTRAGLWDELDTDWVCLDCELMPWSAKAQELLREQYAAVGAAARAALADAASALEQAAGARRRRGRAAGRHWRARARMAGQYVDAYRRYCWPVHVAGRPSWRRSTCWPARAASTSTGTTSGTWRRWRALCAADDAAARWRPQPASGRRSTDAASRGGGHRLVGGADRRAAARAWWSSRSTSSRAGARGLVQPAVKCRGREYLRIIYGPEYTAPEQPGAAALARPGRQAVAGAARVRAGDRGAGALRARASRCAACTSASSACWRWRASRSIRGCDGGELPHPPGPLSEERGSRNDQAGSKHRLSSRERGPGGEVTPRLASHNHRAYPRNSD